jgi:protein-S-isoprenylcysteine O-methyltransferase Ste14
MRRAFWSSTVSNLFIGPLLFLLCLRQWGTDHPWSRLDFYTGSFLVLGIFIAIEEAITFARSAFRSKEVAHEALGISYDPLLFRSGTLLNAAILLVVLDYAHWHLVPALARPLLQGLGVALGVLGAIWQTWADAWLGRHFASDPPLRKLMTGGPFRFVRHPRYAAFLVRKLAWPLLFASPIGWALLPVWLVLLSKRIRREEAHMTELFGTEYAAYAHRTARLLPGMY